MKLLSADIASIVNGTLTGPPDLPFTGIATDSRQLIYSEGLAFFAISGRNHDGHQFIGSLYDEGVRIFVVEYIPASCSAFSDAAFILTDNTVAALQKLAAQRRKDVRSRVIAVTGSAGKTVVKEWLAEIIGLSCPVVRSPKSYNSQIGVPLSVWKLDDKYSYGIFEAGISMPGEMDKLREVIDPDIGVFTNIGDAHRENFSDDREKAAEKLKLFTGTDMLIYCRDHQLIHELIHHDDKLSSKNLVTWSAEGREALVSVSDRVVSGGRTSFTVTYKGREYHFDIPFADRASFENAVTVTATCLATGIDAALLGAGLKKLGPVAMRMEIKSGINNCQLIEDYYNSDPGSLGMALDYLRSQNGKKSTLVLSDFVQSGRDETELYGGVSELVAKAGIGKFIGIGDALCRNRHLFGPGSAFFHSTDEYISSVSAGSFSDEIILLKGARIFEFERIARLLEQRSHQTVLEINLDAISHNLGEFRRQLNPGTRMMVMVKAFAYGAGPSEIAALLAYHRVSYLAVAYADEGVDLRNSGVNLPVMVMNPDPQAADLLIRYNLEPELYSFSSLKNFSDAAARHGLADFPVHLKIDSGMHRLGFLPEETGELCSLISENRFLRVVSVFSHLAASEDPALDHFTHRQATVFLEAAAALREATGYPFIRHILNSSGIARFPQYQFEMVRPGIGIYGAAPQPGLALRPTGRFITRISQVKKVAAGEPVGYGCRDVSGHDRMIAILPVGYADGLSRQLGNGNGSLFIRGKRVPITGNVCMDMCMADITGAGAMEGDEAEIFGRNITIGEVAERCATIPYEILTSVPARVKRVFFRE